CRITWPSLRTNWQVETPTLAVWGEIGFPASAPTELNVGKIRTGRFSNLPVMAWTGPNMAFVAALLPERATPIQPRMGASTTKNNPILESPKASELAMPVKTKTYARPKMKKATSNAPHICRNVREKTCFRVLKLGRRMARITSQDARVDVPPPNGLKLNIDEMG